MLRNKQLISIGKKLGYIGTFEVIFLYIAIFQLIENIFVAIFVIIMLSVGTLALSFFIGGFGIKPRLKLTQTAPLQLDNYIKINVVKEYQEGGVTIKLQETAEYPLLIGIRTEENIGELDISKRALEPGQEAFIHTETENEVLKGKKFHIEYPDYSTSVYTETEDTYDGYLIVSTDEKPKSVDNLIETFAISQGDIQ